MRILRFTSLMLFVCLSLHAQAPKTYIELILDASGSMHAPIEHQTRMIVAKKALSSYVKAMDKKTHLGLRVYGHRKKGDCKDSELLVPIGTNNRPNILSEIQKLQPLSMTPIGYSLKRAVGDLNKFQGNLGIVLISDGKESCKMDPCKTAKDIKKSGNNIKINVVGFDIQDKQTDKQLACIAKATGGIYTKASNIDELYKRLEKSVGEIKIQDWNLEVQTLRSVFNHYTVTDEKTGKVVIKDKIASIRSLLPPGSYTIAIDTNPPSIRKNVWIKKGKKTIVNIKGFGTLKVDTLMDLDFRIDVFDEQGRQVVKEKLAYTAQDLSVGTYRIVVKKQGKVMWETKNIKITANKRTNVHLPGYGRIRIKTTYDSLSYKVQYISKITGQVAAKNYSSYYMIVPVGKYDAILKGRGLEKKFRDMIVKEDQDTQITLNTDR